MKPNKFINRTQTSLELERSLQESIIEKAGNYSHIPKIKPETTKHSLFRPSKSCFRSDLTNISTIENTPTCKLRVHTELFANQETVEMQITRSTLKKQYLEEQQGIHRQNVRVAQSILRAKPFLQLKSFESSYQEHLEHLKRISRYQQQTIKVKRKKNGANRLFPELTRHPIKSVQQSSKRNITSSLAK